MSAGTLSRYLTAASASGCSVLPCALSFGEFVDAYEAVRKTYSPLMTVKTQVGAGF